MRPSIQNLSSARRGSALPKRPRRARSQACLAQAIEQLEGRMLLTLTGTVSTPAADTNLTTEGTLDWA